MLAGEMSNVTSSEDGTRENADFSLTKAVEDVSQHSHAQTEALEEKLQALSALQTALSAVERKGEAAKQELRSKVREHLLLEGEMEHLEQQINVLHDRCALAIKESVELQSRVSEEEERARMALAVFDTYRNKMKGHRAAAFHALTQTDVHKELEEKRALLSMLRQKKEEKKRDLENPNGNIVPMAKKGMDAVKEDISATRRRIAERREQLHKECETHAQLKKDIEIQNRRYEAIVKRLHCQLSRAQAVHRQMSEEIYHMERQLAELKRRHES